LLFSQFVAGLPLLGGPAVDSPFGEADEHVLIEVTSEHACQEVQVALLVDIKPSVFRVEAHYEDVDLLQGLQSDHHLDHVLRVPPFGVTESRCVDKKDGMIPRV